MAQLLEARLISQAIELRNYVEKDHVIGTIYIAFVERIQGCGVISQTRVQDRDVIGRDIALSGLGLELIEHPECIGASSCDSIGMPKRCHHGRATRGEESRLLEFVDRLSVLPFLLVTLAQHDMRKQITRIHFDGVGEL